MPAIESLVIIIPAVFVAIVSYKLYKGIYGLLYRLWKPFQLMLVGVTPLILWHSADFVEWILNITIVSEATREIVEHSLIGFALIMFGYALIIARKIFVDYGTFEKNVKEQEKKEEVPEIEEVEEKEEIPAKEENVKEESAE